MRIIRAMVGSRPEEVAVAYPSLSATLRLVATARVDLSWLGRESRGHERDGSSYLMAPCRAEGTRLDTAIRDACLSTPIAGTADLLSSVERSLRGEDRS